MTCAGVAIAHLPANRRRYLGSPSLAILPGGNLVASHDDFGPRSNLDQTWLYRSADRGQTWMPLAEITGQYWSTLFVHRESLFLLGTVREYGDIVLRRSDDGGETWTVPRDANSGLLQTGGQYHCAPVPVLRHGGRLWRAMERRQPAQGWAENFQALVLSASEDADLLEARAWRCSDPLTFDPAWGFGGWLEGNVVATPHGTLVNLLRTDTRGAERAAWVEVSEDGGHLHFDPQTGLVPLPGGCKKFTIRFDADSGLYWSLTNPTKNVSLADVPGSIRNTLALICSPDLRHWEVRAVLWHHPDRRQHGFQYVDWQFDGDDLVAVVRVADDDDDGGAHNAHDANFLMFLRVPQFREANGE